MYSHQRAPGYRASTGTYTRVWSDPRRGGIVAVNLDGAMIAGAALSDNRGQPRGR